MARKAKNHAEQPADDGGKSYSFRAPADLSRELDYVADALGLDVSNLLRLILRQKLHEYRALADEALARRPSQGGEKS